MHLEDGHALLEVGHVHVDLPVEPARAHQGAVQHVGTVGGPDQDHPGVGAEAVHLGQQLVQGVLPLVVGTHAHAAATRPSDRIDLIDEDDAGGLLLRLLEQVAHTAGTHAHEHLHEVRAAQREEGHLGLTGHRLGEQRLAGARRAHEQGALGDLGTEVGVLLRVLQEVHDLLELLLGLIEPGHIVEGDVGALAALEDLGPALADVEDLATGSSAATDAAHHEHPDGDHDAQEQHPLQHLAAPVVLALEGVAHAVVLVELLQLLLEGVDGPDVERVVRAAHVGAGHHGPGDARLVRFLVQLVALDVDLGHLIVDDHDAFHIAVLHHLLVLHGFDLHRSATHGEEVDRQDHHDDDPVDPVEIEGALGLVAVVARSFGLIVRLLHGSGPLRFVQATLSYTCRAASAHRSSSP